VRAALTKEVELPQRRSVAEPQRTPPSVNYDNPYIRLLDITIAAALILALAPLLALVAMIIYVSDPGPVLFGHKRIGRGGQTFLCLKFRSMVVDAQQRLQELLASDPVARAEWERDHKLKRDPRITAIGSFLRQSSLDELPQLFNVLRGDMSLVGPRPIVFDEVPRYRRYFSDYCEVRPGITGLWQVSGRNDVSYRRRVAMDVTYVRSASLRLNLRILAMTVPSVLKSQGSY
jgi:lipopolysaccharide/colanic/teichoic acid biosynthesis glycosyltransferase